MTIDNDIEALRRIVEHEPPEPEDLTLARADQIVAVGHAVGVLLGIATWASAVLVAAHFIAKAW